MAHEPDKIEERYLDLLKGVITDTIWRTELDFDEIDKDRFVATFIERYIDGPAICMLPRVRLDSLQHLVSDVICRGIPGDLIEAGVWRGGTGIFLRALLKCFGETKRVVWLADSFEGLPAPDEKLFPREAEVHRGAVMSKAYRHFAVGLPEVMRNFSQFDLLDENVQFIKGWFGEALPSAPLTSLCLARIDADYYMSTWDALSHLYPLLEPGGVVIVDDYGETGWTYCKEAVDEFRSQHSIRSELTYVDRSCVWWMKEKE